MARFLRDPRDMTVYRVANNMQDVIMVQSAAHLAALGGTPGQVVNASSAELATLGSRLRPGAGTGLVPSGGPSMSLGSTIGKIGEGAGKIGDFFGKLGGLFGGTGPATGVPGLPPLPPGAFGTPGQVGATGQAPATAAPGVRGWLERVLPGGSSGYLAMAQPTVEVQMRQVAWVPRGYVVVDLGNGQKVGMLKPLARALKLWKPSPKPPVSGWDMRAINRASGAKKRVKTLAGKVGLTATERGRARRSSSSSRTRKR